MIINIVDALFSVILVWILLPKYGIIGYVITVYFTELVNATLSITKLICVTNVKLKIIDLVAKPIFAIILATASIRFVLSAGGIFASSIFEIIIHILLVSLIYFFCLIVFRAIKLKEIKRSVVNFFKA